MPATYFKSEPRSSSVTVGRRRGLRAPNFERPFSADSAAVPLMQLPQRAGTRAAATGSFPAVVNEAFRSPGAPLDDASKAFFEPRFRFDFGNVRLHAGADAARAARSLHADAFTVGSDIGFGHQKLAPSSLQGRALLAHELAHVVQQSNRKGNAGGANSIPAQETQAEAAAVASLQETPDMPAQPFSELALRLQTAGSPSYAPLPEPVVRALLEDMEATFRQLNKNAVAEQIFAAIYHVDSSGKVKRKIIGTNTSKKIHAERNAVDKFKIDEVEPGDSVFMGADKKFCELGEYAVKTPCFEILDNFGDEVKAKGGRFRAYVDQYNLGKEKTAAGEEVTALKDVKKGIKTGENRILSEMKDLAKDPALPGAGGKTPVGKSPAPGATGGVGSGPKTSKAAGGGAEVGPTTEIAQNQGAVESAPPSKASAMKDVLPDASPKDTSVVESAKSAAPPEGLKGLSTDIKLKKLPEDIGEKGGGAELAESGLVEGAKTAGKFAKFAGRALEWLPVAVVVGEALYKLYIKNSDIDAINRQLRDRVVEELKWVKPAGSKDPIVANFSIVSVYHCGLSWGKPAKEFNEKEKQAAGAQCEYEKSSLGDVSLSNKYEDPPETSALVDAGGNLYKLETRHFSETLRFHEYFALTDLVLEVKPGMDAYQYANLVLQALYPKNYVPAFLNPPEEGSAPVAFDILNRLSFTDMISTLKVLGKEKFSIPMGGRPGFAMKVLRLSGRTTPVTPSEVLALDEEMDVLGLSKADKDLVHGML